MITDCGAIHQTSADDHYFEDDDDIIEEGLSVTARSKPPFQFTKQFIPDKGNLDKNK